MGTNELTAIYPRKLASAWSRLMKGRWKKEAIPLLWYGRVAERMVKQLGEESAGLIR